MLCFCYLFVKFLVCVCKSINNLRKKRPTGNLKGSVHVHTVSLNSLHLYLKQQQQKQQEETNKRPCFQPRTNFTRWLTQVSFYPPPPPPFPSLTWNDREEKEDPGNEVVSRLVLQTIWKRHVHCSKMAMRISGQLLIFGGVFFVSISSGNWGAKGTLKNCNFVLKASKPRQN